MHHAPAGPPLSTRVAGLLARLRFRTAGLLAPLAGLLLVLRRTRVLPVALTALALGASALAAPLAPYDDDARSTAALTSDAGGLIPATGDGWTQDGVPADPTPADDASPKSRSASEGPSSSAGPPPASSTEADDPTTASAAGPSSSSSASSAAGTSSSGTTSSSGSSSGSSSSPRPPTSGSDGAPAGTASSSPSGTPEVVAPAVDPADTVLAVVNTARAGAGCTALIADAGLAALAGEHSAAMQDGGAPPDLGGRTAVVATGTDPAAVAAGWAADADLLDCGLTAAGVGTTGGYWTLVAA